MGIFSIQIVPDLGCKRKIRSLMKYYSKKLNKHEALIDRAHFTIITSFKTNKIDNLINDIKNLKLNKFKDKINGPFLFGNSFLYLKPVDDSKMGNIHNQIIELLPKYRIKWVHEGFQNIKVSTKKRKYLAKYGDIFCKEFFMPHLTLCGFNFQKNVSKKSRSLFNKKIEFKILVNKLLVLKKKKNKWMNYATIHLNDN